MSSFDGLHTCIPSSRAPVPQMPFVQAGLAEAGFSGAEAPFGQDIEAERTQLEAERAACERKLDQLKTDIDSNNHALAWSRGQAERDVQAKLAFLASVSPDLRTPLHTMLGYIELLRRDGGLNPVQSMRVNAVLDAGLHLLDRVNCVLTLSEAGGSQEGSAAHACPDVVEHDDGAVAREGVGAGDGMGPRDGLRVLVVDDMAMNRDIAAAFLTGAGHHVTIAEDGPQAVLAVSAEEFDVVLMDVRMPGMDGLEATRQIRGLGRGRGEMPIVALTALAFDEQVADCRQAGMNGHLAKPFSPATLCGAIAQAATGSAARRACVPPRAGVPAGSRLGPDRPVVSLAAFRGAQAATDGVSTRSLGADGANARGRQAWLDIASPWVRRASVSSLAGPGTGVRPQGDAAFVLKMASVTSKSGRRLVDGKLTCAPPPEQTLFEFHWLLFAQAPGEVPQSFSAACDLWRWNGTGWRSVTVPGAQFSADEMYDQGWRYCGPCADKVARVDILPGGFVRGAGDMSGI